MVGVGATVTASSQDKEDLSSGEDSWSVSLTRSSTLGYPSSSSEGTLARDANGGEDLLFAKTLEETPLQNLRGQTPVQPAQLWWWVILVLA